MPTNDETEDAASARLERIAELLEQVLLQLQELNSNVVQLGERMLAGGG